MSSIRPVSQERESQDMLPSNHGTHVPGSQANTPIEGLASLKSNPGEVLKQLYKLRATAIKTPFKDCHHEDAFLHHVNEICQAETEPSIKLNQPFAGMAAPS